MDGLSIHNAKWNKLENVKFCIWSHLHTESSKKCKENKIRFVVTWEGRLGMKAVKGTDPVIRQISTKDGVYNIMTTVITALWLLWKSFRG